MTRHGNVVRFYTEIFEPRPHSRFTAVPSELAANAAWLERAVRWGDDHVDAVGHLTVGQIRSDRGLTRTEENLASREGQILIGTGRTGVSPRSDRGPDPEDR